MSSDYEEVRLLAAALAMKIEQSWRLLGAQHISNSIFGLQVLTYYLPPSFLTHDSDKCDLSVYDWMGYV